MKKLQRRHDGTKFCPKCVAIKATTDFAKNAGRSDGLNSWCRNCTSARSRQWIAKNRIGYDPAAFPSKLCRKCNTEKDRSDFHTSFGSKDGLYLYCKKCVSAINAAQSAREDVRAKRRLRDGLPIPTRPEPNACEICGSHRSKKSSLHLDHVHQTGHFRGWLCGNCNRALGCFKDDINVIRRAIAYLCAGSPPSSRNTTPSFSVSHRETERACTPP